MRRILSILTIAYMLVATILPFVFNNGVDNIGVDNFGVKYCGNDSDIIYLDNEAIALSSASDADTGLRSEALEAFGQINDIRAEAGLDELSWNQNLETVSSVRAKECEVKFSHTRPNGQQWYTVNSKLQGGENLAFGFDTADDAVDAWMNSPTHKDNILYDEFTNGSISIYQSDDGTCYWANEFGY